MYDMHNGTLSELCDPVRNANKELIINELSKIMFKYNIEDTCLNIGKVQQMKLYKELCSKINEMFDNEYRAEKDCISDILSQTTKDSYYINSFVTGLGTSYTLKPVSNKTLQEIINHKIDGKMWSERLWDDKVNLRKDLKLQVKKFFNGEINVNNISDVIEKKYRNNRYVTNRLVNNEISIIQEDVNDVWRENHNIKTVLYMGTLDFKICSKCSQYDGKSYNSDDRPIELPQHVGCRCTYVNIPNADWRPKMHIDNETKENINWQSFEEWKEKH
ncbi:putative phage head protein [Clostridium botulinum B str. Eklund 17B (NRP)]|nr:putative phage head protein [Clostridium botulinum B str. Eklund 17B (NRP)]